MPVRTQAAQQERARLIETLSRRQELLWNRIRHNPDPSQTGFVRWIAGYVAISDVIEYLQDDPDNDPNQARSFAADLARQVADLAELTERGGGALSSVRQYMWAYVNELKGA